MHRPMQRLGLGLHFEKKRGNFLTIQSNLEEPFSFFMIKILL
jgi:hypothetical protein